MTDRSYLSWREYEHLLRVAVESLPRPISEFQYVTGVPRGGLIAAVWLSHQYDLKFISLPEALALGALRAALIIADDICDSGSTLAGGLGTIRAFGDSSAHLNAYFCHGAGPQ